MFLSIWLTRKHPVVECNPVDCSHQAPLSMEFSRQEHWSGLPFPSSGEFPDPRIEPIALQADTLLFEPPGKFPIFTVVECVCRFCSPNIKGKNYIPQQLIWKGQGWNLNLIFFSLWKYPDSLSCTLSVSVGSESSWVHGRWKPGQCAVQQLGKTLEVCVSHFWFILLHSVKQLSET